MPQRTAVVGAAAGLHARPAHLFVEAATRTGLPVTIAVAGRPPVDARSILMVMTLGATQGTEVTLAVEGDGADAALDALVGQLESDPDAVPGG